MTQAAAPKNGLQEDNQLLNFDNEIIEQNVENNPNEQFGRI